MSPSLKKSIVVVNEYARIDVDAGRGKTPGQYVVRYMARGDAVEQLAPIRHDDIDHFITRYMARGDAVEEAIASVRRGEGEASESEDGLHPTKSKAGSTLRQRRRQRSQRRQTLRLARERVAAGVEGLKGRFRRDRGLGGIAFGHESVSLSDEQVRRCSAEIQDLFDDGHAVLKTVLSFEHEYLQNYGIIDAELDKNDVHRGSYRGRIDQMKLRMAIREGMDALQRRCGYDDLRYVAVIQVDTKQVHCHLAIVDAGYGRRTKDGKQSGYITDVGKRVLRRAVDSWLGDHQHVAQLSSAVGYERRNVVSYIKRWAYETASVESSGQLLLACLPEDRSLWRVGSNDRRMMRPNKLARQLVMERLALPGSPMAEAMAPVYDYARTRRQNEGLSRSEYDRLVAVGEQRIIDRCVNGVYGVLGAVADTEREVSTPLLEAMGSDIDDLIDAVDRRAEDQRNNAQTATTSGTETLSPDEVGLRMRSWSARLEHHRRMREFYHAEVLTYDEHAATGDVAPESIALRHFYEGEEDYHHKCQAKYQHFLGFLGTVGETDWAKQWRDVSDYGDRVRGLMSLRADKSIPKMRDRTEAEKLGRELYDQPGGALLAQRGAAGRSGREVIDARIEKMLQRYARMVDDLEVSWSGLGAQLEAVSDDDEAVDYETINLGGDVLDEDVSTPGAAVRVRVSPAFELEEVKGLDMHDMGTDWAVDQPVGPRTLSRFSDMAAARRRNIIAAETYLRDSNQIEDITTELSVAHADVRRMERLVPQIERRGMLPSRLAEVARARRQARRQAQLAAQAATERQQTQAGQSDPQYSELAGDKTGGGATVRLDGGLDSRLTEAVFSRAVDDDFSRE